MWKDGILLQKLKEKRPKEEPDQEAKQEASRWKKLSRAQDSILKYVVKIMEVCNAQGFVYGIISEKGGPVTGSSDSLREWWKESNSLMVNNSVWRTTTRILANPRKLGAFEDLGYIRISLQLVAVFLPRSQVTTDETKTCLM
ncbi:hypothetical protein VIGAN_01084500 [Vigna angularis var. angularis]|uniref:Ethylene insensitive 3-like DNA-binding domain-containing protein n=1 Tax=Vigna angularis var. angularis TaxID=157739 RepID=A0A0S3QYJ3_PHAAN|nr:hypothetical protein VIGAN_01084500 [Vigna angularis var. angularis]